MNQDRVNQLATEHYGPAYSQHAMHDEMVEIATTIAAEEKAKGLDELQTLRGIRSRIHEALQLRVPVVDPSLTASTAKEARAKIEEHHDHQTAHFQALWKIADELAARVTS